MGYLIRYQGASGQKLSNASWVTYGADRSSSRTGREVDPRGPGVHLRRARSLAIARDWLQREIMDSAGRPEEAEHAGEALEIRMALAQASMVEVGQVVTVGHYDHWIEEVD